MPDIHELTELQITILRHLWSRGEASVAEVWEPLHASRGLAQTTVATLLTRLERSIRAIDVTKMTIETQGKRAVLSVDGQALWLRARTGNGVFETSAGAGVANAWIDNGQVSDPSAITGSTYTLQFTVAAGVTTYAVLQDGLPTAVTAAPYVSGQDIVLDGMSFKITGTPATGDTFTAQPSSSTLSIFDALDTAIADLDTAGLTPSQIAQNTTDNLRNIDSAMTFLGRARSLAGEALLRVDNETGRLDAQKLAAQTERSNAEDLDMVDAISKFQNQQTGYDAALKSYSMVQRMSLFQYLG